MKTSNSTWGNVGNLARISSMLSSLLVQGQGVGDKAIKIPTKFWQRFHTRVPRRGIDQIKHIKTNQLHIKSIIQYIFRISLTLYL